MTIAKFKIQNSKFKISIQNLKFYIFTCNFAFCILSFTLFYGCQRQQLYKDSQIMMGTSVEVVSPDRRARDIVFNEVKRIENLLSKYKEDSEISRLNKLGKLKVSPETMRIFEKSKEFWSISDGVFDITIGPLMDLWGFTDKKYYLPKEKEIKETLNLVGMNKIIFNQQDNVIQFITLGMKIDLGAIAKGYAVDCAVSRLKEKGIRNCLINAGGDIYGLGDKFGKPWNVAIQDPEGEDFIDYLELENKAVATSGDYEQYFIKGNNRYVHVFNPRTGYPTVAGLSSVTVIAPDCLTADALATSIFVLGREQGLNLAQKFSDVKVKIVERKDVSYNQ